MTWGWYFDEVPIAFSGYKTRDEAMDAAIHNAGVRGVSIRRLYVGPVVHDDGRDIVEGNRLTVNDIITHLTRTRVR